MGNHRGFMFYITGEGNIVEAGDIESAWLVIPPIIIFVFLLLTRFFSHFHFFIEITSKSMSFPLAINHGYTDV